MSKYHNDNSYSTLPGQLEFCRKRYRRVEPSAKGFAAWWNPAVAQNTEWEDRLAEHLLVGDSCAACVVSIDPLLVAVYANDLDCVAMLRFPAWLAEEHGLQLESRVLSINTYHTPVQLATFDAGRGCASDLVLGPNNTGWLANIFPIVADFFSDDSQQIAKLKSQIPEEDWRRCLNLGRDYRERFPKRWRDGSPLKSWIPAKDGANQPGVFTRLLALKYFVLMLGVTAVGMLGLMAFIAERNWPMVALFAIAEFAAAAMTLRLFYALIWGNS